MRLHLQKELRIRQNVIFGVQCCFRKCRGCADLNNFLLGSSQKESSRQNGMLRIWRKDMQCVREIGNLKIEVNRKDVRNSNHV